MSNPYEPLKERGADVRKEVLGLEWIEDSIERGKVFGGDFQEIVTSLVWGGIWTRAGLSLRDRSLVTVAVLAALNRTEQLGQHIEGALKNGCTKEELEEAFVQIGAYAGFPTTVTAIGIAQKIVADKANTAE